MWKWPVVVVAVGLALPTGLAAQQSASAEPSSAMLQRSFVFLQDELRVAVAGEAPGTIQIVRGEAGRIELTARGVGGVPAAGLSGSVPAELTLASAGAVRTEYVLVVPSDVRVTISRAGQPGVTLGTLDRAARWSWPPQAAPARELPRD